MSSKTDVVVKMSLMFFIALLSFSIGTFVGKKFSDNQHQLAALEPQKINHSAEREVASVSTHEEGKVGTMTDEEIAKLAAEFVADETTSTGEAAPTDNPSEENANTETHSSVAVGTTTETKSEPKMDAHKPATGKGDKASVTKSQEPSATAQAIASGKTAVALDSVESNVKGTESRIPSSLPTDVAQFAVGKFTVQVASYDDEAEAQRMASDLKNRGYSAFYIPANIKGKTWYRVSVGQFATLKEAQTYRTELVSKAKVGSAIVQKITE